MQIDSYLIKKKLGGEKNLCGVVYVATKNNEYYAVKTFKNRSPADKRSFLLEVEFYTNFKHPRLLKLYHSEWNGKFVDEKN